MRPAPMRICFALCVIFALLCPALIVQADTPFPRYDIIKPNVDFWTKVYSEYSTSQAIVHDSDNLDIIYAIIDLKPHEAPAAQKTNRRRMKNAKAKYERILKQLAADPDTDDPECRRVAALFDSRSTSKSYRAAGRRIRCQIGQSDRFRAGLIRSGAYIDQIKTIFKSHGLPEELAYLPHVESSFNPKAYSKFGAAGIWQFTRSTGKRFMKVGYVLDERRDPILATYAAAQLLKENYRKLGSWPLALTAYNHGATGMERARKSLGDYPAIFSSYRSRTFKFASRNFYSEFLAAAEVASNYRDHFGDLVLDRPTGFQTIALDGYASFEALCDHLQLPVELARSLNPALRPPVFEGQKLVPKDYPFRIPAGMLLADIPSGLYKEDQKPSHFYTVQRGDTAGKVARTHGVDLSDLILANNLNHRAVIYPKQTLRIPLPGERIPVPANPATEPVEPTLLARTDELDAPTAEAPAEEEHYPQPVLASIIPTAVAPASQGPGGNEPPQNDQPPSVEIVSADVRFEKIIPHTARPAGIIQVEVEETLGHYAEWAGVRTQQIRRLNALPFGRTLDLHQKIRIPLDQTTAQKFEENRYEFHKRLQEDFFAVYRVSALQAYRVTRGDNLWNLSLEKFEIPLWLLKNCNPEVDFAALHTHQKLMVPLIEKIGTEGPEDLPSESESDSMRISMEKPKAAAS